MTENYGSNYSFVSFFKNISSLKIVFFGIEYFFSGIKIVSILLINKNY